MLTLVARTAGLLGGLLWVARLVADNDVLRWAGLVLLAVAGAGAGAALVSSSASWLRLIVAVALPVLVWSVLEVLHEGGDDAVIDAVVGGAVALVCLLGMARARSAGSSTKTPRAVGRHSG